MSTYLIFLKHVKFGPEIVQNGKKPNAGPPLKINELNQDLGKKCVPARPMAFVFILSFLYQQDFPLTSPDWRDIN